MEGEKAGAAGVLLWVGCIRSLLSLWMNINEEFDVAACFESLDFGSKEWEDFNSMTKKSRSALIDEYKGAWLWCVLCGVLSHGVMFVNKFAWHDDSNLLFAMLDWNVGRWLASLLALAAAKVSGGYNYSLPLVNGMITIFLIAFSYCIILHLLDIRNKYLRIGLGAIFAAFPVVTATFGYMFLSPYYFLALLCAVAGVVFVTSENKYWWMLASLCFGCVAALYPAYISVFLSLMLLWMLAETNRETMKWKRFFMLGIRFVGTSVSGMLFYVLSNRFFLWYTDSQLAGYQGINDMKNNELNLYINGIKNAYLFFVFPSRRKEYGNYSSSYMYPIGIEKIYYFTLCIVCAAAVVMLWKACRLSMRKAAQTAVLLLLCPIAFNFIYVMCPSEKTTIHTLMVYGEVFLFVLAAWGIEHVITVKEDVGLWKAFRHIGTVVLLLAGVMFMYLDNVIYLRMQLQYMQYQSEMTVLVSRIESEEGYQDHMPVAFVITGRNDHTVPDYPAFSDINGMIPYSAEYMYPAGSRYGLENFLKNTCGFAPAVVDEAEYVHLPEVEQMPLYPDSGSIQILDGVVVVKF